MVSISGGDLILLTHGDGGSLTRELVSSVFLTRFGGEGSTDAAVVQLPPGRIALTTDSYVVDPLFFAGGDIGHLAVSGTVNDLLVMGARPLYLAASFMIEEGLPVRTLELVADSMASAAQHAGVQIITGDTKVVERGGVDKLFVTTAGVGVVADGLDLGPHRLLAGDHVIVSGPVGAHGLTVIAERHGFDLGPSIGSDVMPLSGLVVPLLARTSGVRMMRDLTRGGLAGAVAEIAEASARDIYLVERAIPVGDAVRGGCDLLGLDPLYLANEGKFILFIDPGQSDLAVDILRGCAGGQGAGIIGEVRAGEGCAYLTTALGGTRRLELLSGGPLPRIC